MYNILEELSKIVNVYAWDELVGDFTVYVDTNDKRYNQVISILQRYGIKYWVHPRSIDLNTYVEA